MTIEIKELITMKCMQTGAMIKYIMEEEEWNVIVVERIWFLFTMYISVLTVKMKSGDGDLYICKYCKKEINQKNTKSYDRNSKFICGTCYI